MKPPELTVYPKSRGMFGAQYDLADGRHMLAREGADVLSRNKRLTDAELAAEWHKQDNYCGQVVEGYSVSHDGGCAFESEEAEIEKLTTLHRFATLPHYDEATL